MHSEGSGITTFKIYDGNIHMMMPEVLTPAIDLRQIARVKRVSINVINGGGGVVVIREYRGPEANLISTTSGYTLFYQYGVSYTDTWTVWRKCENNVATIRTANANSAVAGLFMSVRYVGDPSYNGIHRVIDTLDSWTFRYALTHSDEAQVNDSAGSVQRLVLWYGNSVSTLVKPTPWVKWGIWIPEGTFPIMKVWVHIQ